MDRKCWAGALILTLVAGVSTKLVTSYLQRPRPDAVAVTDNKNAADDARLPFMTLPRSHAPMAAPVAQITVLDDVHEPIITRPEPLEAGEEFTTPLPTTGGAEESDVAALAAPRPDRDARHMPYADEDDACELIAVVVWLPAPAATFLPHSALVMNVSLPRRPAPDLSEESDEPPISDEPLPSRFHPPHCPYGGHCPYPYR